MSSAHPRRSSEAVYSLELAAQCTYLTNLFSPASTAGVEEVRCLCSPVDDDATEKELCESWQMIALTALVEGCTHTGRRLAECFTHSGRTAFSSRAADL